MSYSLINNKKLYCYFSSFFSFNKCFYFKFILNCLICLNGKNLSGVIGFTFCRNELRFEIGREEKRISSI